ncbi:MAG: ribonuclease, partial [Solirubrobacterales bacterium]|nr:ribonuclease [Solirubrobacterales bacterium]
MSERSGVAAGKTTRLPNDEIERTAKFVREPILLDGEGPEDLAPGTARRLAVDAALAELDAGLEAPSIEWRRQYSLMLGLERLLDAEEATLNDGAKLNEHQVDALSGTLAALVSEIEDPGSNGRGNGAKRGPVDAEAEVESNGTNGASNGAAEADADEALAEDEELAPDEEPQDWEEPESEDDDVVEDAPEDPGA